MDQDQVDAAANGQNDHFQHAHHHLIDAASDQNQDERVGQVLEKTMNMHGNYC